MNSRFKKLQRNLRNNMPEPEKQLWWHIRDNQLGIKFRRQYALGNRIFDFYAPSIRLAIEIDGESHFQSEESRTQELLRDTYLTHRSHIYTLRFLNTDVNTNLENVLEVILTKVKLISDTEVSPT